MIKTRKIGIKILTILLLFIVINCNTSFAKILEIDWSKLEFYIPEVEEQLQEIKDGVYTVACAKDNNYVLDIAWNSLDWGGNLQICKRNGGSNQKFYISYEGEGYYKIANVSSALIIDVEESKKENGANIRQWEDNGADAQRFKIIKNDDGTYNFIAKCSDKALDVNGGIFEEGTNIQQWEYINSDAQKFNLEETEFLPEGIVSIKKATNYDISLDIDNTTPEEGEQLQIWQENGSLAQRFGIHRVGENEVRIRTVASGGWLTAKGSKVVQSGNSKTPVSNANTWEVNWNSGIILKNKENDLYLDIKGDSEKNGTKVQVSEKTENQTSQRFLVNKEHFIEDGWYEITSALGTTLDLDHASSDWGANILTWEKNDQNNQKFNIKYTDEGYLIYSMYGLPIEVKDGKEHNGANVQQWEENGDLCQKWWPKLLDGGYIGFKNAKTGKYLDVADASAELGANVQQWEENGSKAQMWKLTPTEFTSGWFSQNGVMYCADPVTGELVKNCTRVDPMMTDPSQYGSIYDFDSEGRATWHLPTEADITTGIGPSAPIPTLTGDRRQRVIQLALSRLGCPYQSGRAPTGFVCDGLTAWSYTTALGDWFYTGAGSREDLQDASWQWEKIETRNGIKYDQSQLKAGDLVFFGNPQLTYGPGMIDYNGEAYHAGIYYKDDIMINSRGEGGVGFYSVSGYYMGWLGGGSPYEAETSKCEIPH